MTAAGAWKAAGRALLAKMVAEWSYEGMVEPVAAAVAGDDGGDDGGDGAEWRIELGGARYAFRGRRGAFGSWVVDPASLTRGGEPADDPVRFVLDARAVLGLDGVTTCEVVRELVATQLADTRIAARALPAAATAELSYEELESHQGGHPCLVLNKGRLGFSAADAARYAPEAARPLRLRWVAVAAGMARTASTTGGHGELVASELDAGTRRRFTARLRQEGRHAGDRWVWLPVHPFHWDEAVATLLGGEVAAGRIVPLGEAPDRYLPLQSVRTVTNLDRPERHDVKLPLLVRNTLVWRGLAPGPTEAAPAVTAWLHELLAGDAFLRDECRMVVLGEVASATVRGHVYEQVPDAPYRYHELLGALWREPVRRYLAAGERARTMASLLHVGADGRPLVAELVARSGLGAEAWLGRLFEAVLPPLLHWLYRYGVAFCPHGENTVVVFDAAEADAVLLRWGP
ncbi:MAG TPA: IucA/IucC family protein, partial [Acidimicrobiales bacterium]|nr:IucA/IucC family protein [Acidimicrobiales bacterium]